MYDPTHELEHFGVLGMKWGVRRTPAQLGHRQKAELNRYKEKEISKVKKRIAKDERKYKFNKKAAFAEIDAIKEMSYNDMNREKIEIGKRAVIDAIATTGSLAVAILTPIPISVVRWPKPANIKTNMRLKLGRYADKKKSKVSR